MTDQTSQPGAGQDGHSPHPETPSGPGQPPYVGDQAWTPTAGPAQPQPPTAYANPGGHGQQPTHSGYGQPPTYGSPNSYGQPPAYGNPNSYGQQPPGYGDPYGYSQQQGLATQGPGQPRGYGSSYPQGYGQAGHGQWAYGQPMPVRNDYASWGQRVGSYLIDMLPSIVGQVIFLSGYLAFVINLTNTGTATPAGVVPMVIGSLIMLAALGWNIYNRWIIAGRTGQSYGRRVLKIYLVSEETNQPIGAMNAFLRDLVHAVDGAAYIGYLWPLWDEKKQTFSDKIMKTVVVDPAKAVPS